jgi:hypothetical protein
MTDLSRLCEETENEIFFHNALKDKLTALIPNAAFKLIKNKTSSPPASDTVNLILIALLLTLAPGALGYMGTPRTSRVSNVPAKKRAREIQGLEIEYLCDAIAIL